MYSIPPCFHVQYGVLYFDPGSNSSGHFRGLDSTAGVDLPKPGSYDGGHGSADAGERS